MFQFANLFEITAFLSYDFVTKHSPCLSKATLLVTQDPDIFYFAIPELVFMMFIAPKLKLFTYSNSISNLNTYLPKILTISLTQKFCVSVLGLVKINHLLMHPKILCDYEHFLYSFYNFFY